MARIRRPKKINGSEYTFGGGSGAAASGSAAGGFVKIARGHPDRTNADHRGFISSGDTVYVTLDAGTSISTKDSYFYFDNAFETETGSFSYEFTNGDTALPAGVNWSSDGDSANTDMGSARFYGTPSNVGTNTFKIKASYPRGDDAEQVEITYVLKVLPSGTTPVWSSTSLPERIIRNTTTENTLVAGPTTTYSGATYSLSNVSGFNSAVTPIIETDTGRVYVGPVGEVVAAAVAHAFTVTVDLGEYGTISQDFTGNVAYGDAYGARYFGPANARTNFQGSQNFTLAESEYYHNPLKNSGALRRIWDVRQDTSPYLTNDGYGCQPNDNYNPSQSTFDNMSGYHKNGYMGIYPGAQVFASGSNHQCITGYWTVPAGVTSISAVVVGAGSNGAYQWAENGGGGGGLAWMNGISVTPGEVLQWCWGLGHSVEANNGGYGAGSSWLRRHSGGPNTEHIIFGQGGGYTGYTTSVPNGQSTSYTGGNVTVSGLNHWDKGSGYGTNQQPDGGGWGVNTSEGSAVDDGTGTTWHYGGGAAHYASDRSGTGAGGYRSNQLSGGSNQEGYYGGGGNGYDYSSTHGYGAGGGVGLDGQGSRGTHGEDAPRNSTQAGSGYAGNGGSWTSYNFGSPNFYGGGGGGSGGTRGAWGAQQFTGSAENGNGNGHRGGGMHGGGGGGAGTRSGGGHGAPGGVRIIWGIGEDGTARSFPYTYCSEKPSMKYNGEA